MGPVEYGLLAAGWIAWVTPFAFKKRHASTAAKTDPRARWGILLQAIAYSLLWQGRFWTRSPGELRIAFSAASFLIAAWLCWTSVNALGRQWRLDAGVNTDHQLVRAGAYRFIRHPIYTSMFFLLLGTGLLVTPWPMLLISLILLAIGTQIRARIEDKLLAECFGASFDQYRREVGAYLPMPKRV